MKPKEKIYYEIEDFDDAIYCRGLKGEKDEKIKKKKKGN